MKHKTKDKTPLKVLYLEDSPPDIAIIRELLVDAGYQFSMDCTDTEKEFGSFLRSHPYDVILSDFKLPGFDAFGALKLANEICPATPFICVSGSIGEETAIELIKQGAVDYVLKDRLVRLPSAVQRALNEVKEKDARTKAEAALARSEKAYREVVENATDIIYSTDGDGKFTYANPAALRITGYSLDELVHLKYTDLILPDHRKRVIRTYMRQVLKGQATSYVEYPYRTKSGDVKWVGQNATVVRASGKVVGFQVIARDITERILAQQAVRESEERYRALFTFSPDALYVHVNNRVVLVNPSFCQLLGAAEPSQLIGKSVFEIIHPQFHEKVRERWNLVFRGRPAPLLEERFIRLDGTEVQVEVSAVLIDWEGSKGVQVIARDITERRRVEEALRESQSLYHSFVEQLPAAAFRKDSAGRYVMVNSQFCKLKGLKAEEFLGKKPVDVANMDSAKNVETGQATKYAGQGEEAHDLIMRTGKVVETEEEYRAADGGKLFMHVVRMPVFGPDRTIVGTQGILFDITERKRAEEAVRASEQIIEGILNAIPVRVFWKDRNLVYLGCNAVFARDAGFENPKEIIGKDDYTMGWRNQAELYRNDDHQVIEGGNSKLNIEESQTTPEGNTVTLLTSKIPLRDSKGEISGVLGTYLDISERKQAEEALRKSEDVYRTIFENTGTANVLIEEDTVISLANAEFTQLSGYSREEIEGKKKWTEFVEQEDLARMLAQHQLRRQNREAALRHYEFRFIDRRKNIHEIYLTIELIPGTKRSIASLLDITDRKRAEDALRQSEEHFRQLYQLAPIGITNVTGNGRFLRANAALEKILGYSEQELQEMTFDRLTHPEDRQGSGDWLRSVVQGAKEYVEGDKRYIRKDGSIVWVHLTVSAVKDRHGRFLYTISLLEDITQRKQAEEARLALETRYRRLFEAAKDGILILDADTGMVVDVNPFLLTMLGYSHEQFLGKKVWELGFLKDIIANKENFAELQQKGYVRYEDRPLEASDGRRKDVEFVSNVYQVNQHKVIQCNIRDITERKRAEEELRTNEALLRTSVENLPLIFYIVDPRGTFTLSIGAGLKGLGLKPNQMVGQSVFDVYKEFPEITDSVQRALRGESVEFESHVADSSFANFLVPFSTGKGDFAGIVGVALDISERKRAEQQINLLAHTVKSITECVSITDMNDTLLFVNNAFLKTYGYVEHEILGKNINIIGSPNNPPGLLNDLRKAAREEGWQGELLNRTRDGREFPTALSTSIVRDDNGKAVALVGVAADITERKITEQAQLLLSTALESTANGVVITDLKGNIEWVNNAFVLMTGYTAAEVEGQNPRILKSGKQDDSFYKQLWETISAGNVWTGELINKKKDGTLYADETTITPLRNKNGVITNFIAIKQDITDRKRSQESLKLFRTLVDNAADSIEVIDPTTGRFVEANEKAWQSVGYGREEFLSLKLSDIDPTVRLPLENALLEQLKTSGFARIEGAHRRKDGTEFPVEVNLRFVHLDKDYVVSSSRDITDRKRMEEAILYEQSLLKALMDNIPDHVYFKDRESRFLRMSRSLANRFGLNDPAQSLGKTDSEFFSEEHARQAFQDEQKVMNSGLAMIGVEEKESWPDGAESWVSTTKVPLQDVEGHIIGTFGVSRDITRSKEAEKALMESEEKYRSLFERNLAATFVSTPSGKVLDCNPAYVQMFGFDTYEQATSTNMARLYGDPKDRSMVLTTLEEHKKAEDMHFRMVKIDGTPMYIIANLVGKFDERGQLVQKTGYLIDDTKRHRLEKELIQAQKLESLGILAGGIAHDFNNILGILMGHVSLLDRIKDNPEFHKTSLDAIDTALKRGTGLVRQLLTFARKSDVEFAPLLVNDVVKELIRLLRETLPRTIEIVTDLNPRLPAIVADGGQIHQVLLNLCVNARDAMHAGGRIRIQTNLADGSHVRQRFPTALSDKYVSIEVRDTGAGMDEATKTRIFEPFFTTKESGKGTGLGLAVVFGVVQTHKGFIDVESQIGKGTTFCIYLPVEVTQSVGPNKLTTGFEESVGGHETILFVEDEPLLFETSKMALASKGYRVLYAKDGFEAIDMYRQHFKEIQLVLTDMDLPKLGGEKLIKALLEINSKLRIIFASGYVEPEVKAKVLKSGAKAFLAKPYDHVAMLATVREVLDAKE
jgi:two-component system cell cycle sensor histidine kinase/response regulator CckA